jgi:N-succinyldiaminopimelate aminotransferase
MPNPFYQIYEGAALLAGAVAGLSALPRRTRISTRSSPPCPMRRGRAAAAGLRVLAGESVGGRAVDADDYRALLALADRHDFIVVRTNAIRSSTSTKQSAARPARGGVGRRRTNFERCIVMHSLSKRSNVPGLRSGFIAGDAALMKRSSCATAPTMARRCHCRYRLPARRLA